MQIVTTKAELRQVLDAYKGATIGFAPTMGFLHAGHMSLFDAASGNNDLAVASIFVNPTQFGPNEDLDAYPRDPDGDARKCEACGIDVLWMPETPSVYAPDHSSTIHVTGPTEGLCGGARPGHFDGVTTIVAKLFNLVQPTRAYFGQKDFQQLAVIRRMVRDLDMPVEIIGMPIVREEDGLAMSSRNKYLDAEARDAALTLSRSLGVTEALYDNGERDATALVTRLRASLDVDPRVRIDYAQLVDAESLVPVSGVLERPALLAIACFVGGTRLIDNRVLGD